jgi:SPP1 gp7 family putative phage head morphogenesis protein
MTARKRRKPRVVKVTAGESKGHALAYPASIPEKYKIKLRAMIRKMTSATMREVSRLYPEPVAEDAAPDGVVVGMDANIPGSLHSTLDDLLARFQKMFDSQAPELAEQVASGTDKASTTGVKSSLKEASASVTVPTDVLKSGAIADVWNASVDENVSLIKSIPAQYMGRVRKQIGDSITKGHGLSDLLPQLKNIGSMSDRRAKLIAYDQTRKAYAGFNHVKLKGAGVKKFEWLHSSGAAEPRKDHIAMSGNIYSFDDLPIIDQKTGERGIPGQAINCSCRMVPVVEEEQEVSPDSPIAEQQLDGGQEDRQPGQLQDNVQAGIEEIKSERLNEAQTHVAEINARSAPSVVEKESLRKPEEERVEPSGEKFVPAPKPEMPMVADVARWRADGRTEEQIQQDLEAYDRANARMMDRYRSRLPEQLKVDKVEPAKTPVNKVVPVAPEDSHVKNEQQYGSFRNKRAAIAGLSEKAYIAKSEKVLKKYMDESDIYMRVKPATLESILDSGSFKNQFDTGTSGGALNTTSRRGSENALMGISKESPGKDRPVYGYIDRDPHGGMGGPSNVDQYGKVAIKMKSNVKDKSTFTLGDSLDMSAGGTVQRTVATPVSNPGHRSVPYDFGIEDPIDLIERDKHKDLFGYMEAQIHGETTLDHIEEVIFNTAPTKKIQGKLDAAGVKWSVVKKS